MNNTNRLVTVTMLAVVMSSVSAFAGGFDEEMLAEELPKNLKVRKCGPGMIYFHYLGFCIFDKDPVTRYDIHPPTPRLPDGPAPSTYKTKTPRLPDWPPPIGPTCLSCPPDDPDPPWPPDWPPPPTPRLPPIDPTCLSCPDPIDPYANSTGLGIPKPDSTTIHDDLDRIHPDTRNYDFDNFNFNGGGGPGGGGGM